MSKVAAGMIVNRAAYERLLRREELFREALAAIAESMDRTYRWEDFARRNPELADRMRAKGHGMNPPQILAKYARDVLTSAAQITAEGMIEDAKPQADNCDPA